MKKLLLVLLLILAAIGVSAGLFIKFLDLDKVKQRIVESAEAALGQDVELGRISVYFRSGLNLRLSGLKVTGRDEFAGEPLVFIPDAYLRINLPAIFRKEIRIEHVIFDGPEITVVKSRGGRLNTTMDEGQGARGKGQGAKGEGGRAKDGAAQEESFKFLTSRFIVKNAVFRYIDHSGAVPSEFTVSDIDAEVRDISLEKPILFVIKAAVLESAVQNLELTGKVGPLGEKRDLSRLNANLKLALDSVDIARLKSKVPDLKDLPFSGQPFKGILSGSVKNPVTAPSGEITGFTGKLDLDAPSIKTDLFREPLVQTKLKLAVEGQKVIIEKGEAQLGKGKISFSGEMRDFLARRRVTTLKSQLRNVEIHDLVTIGKQERDFTLYGLLNGDLQVAFSGTQQAEIVQTMTGFGQIEITKGLVRNLNVLANVLSRISSIPFIGADIVGYLSPRHRALLAERDMRIDLAQAKFTIGAGEARVEEINIQGDSVLVQGHGHVSLLGRLKLTCALFLSRELSGEITSAFPDLQVLADSQLRLVLPFSVAGEIASPKVVVNRDYIMSRVLPQAGQRVIQKVLGDGGSKAADAASGTASQAQEILKKLLQQ